MDKNKRIVELNEQYKVLKQRKELLGRLTLPYLYMSDNFITTNPDLALEAKSIEKEILTKQNPNMEITIVNPYKSYKEDVELQYVVDNYRNEVLSMIAEITCIGMEMYIISNFDDVTTDTQVIIRSILDKIDPIDEYVTREDIERSMEQYNSGMISESIQYLSDKIGEAMKANEVNVEQDVNTVKEEVKESLRDRAEKAEEKLNSQEEVNEKLDETKDETNKSKSKAFYERHEKRIKIGAAVLGTAVIGYGLYKIYNNITSDDVVVIDSDITASMSADETNSIW